MNVYVALMTELKLQPGKLHEKIIFSERAEISPFDFVYLLTKLCQFDFFFVLLTTRVVFITPRKTEKHPTQFDAFLAKVSDDLRQLGLEPASIKRTSENLVSHF